MSAGFAHCAPISCQLAHRYVVRRSGGQRGHNEVSDRQHDDDATHNDLDVEHTPAIPALRVLIATSFAIWLDLPVSIARAFLLRTHFYCVRSAFSAITLSTIG